MQKTFFILFLIFFQFCLAQEKPIPFRQNNKWGYLDKNGKILISPQYEQVTDFQKNMAGAKVEGNWGIINFSGKWLTSPRFNEININEHGAIATISDSSYIFDINGQFLHASAYRAIWKTEKSIAFQCDMMEISLADTKGNRLKDTYFQDAMPPSENLFAAKVSENKWSFFYETGNLAFKGTFYNVLPFKEGMAAVSNRGENGEDIWGFINYQGEQVIDFQYEKVAAFSQGLALVKRNGLYGYIDKTGKNLVPCQYLQAKDFHQGFACVQKSDKWTYINALGKEIMAENYDYTLDFAEGIGVVMKNGKWGAVDENGKVIISLEYDRIFPCKEGFLAAQKRGQMGYLDKKGEVILPFEYDLCYDFENGKAKVRKTGLYGIINTTGVIQVPFYFQEIGFADTRLNYIEYPERWGFIDKEGNTKIPYMYEEITPFHNGRAMVKFNGRWGYIDKNGKWIVPPIYEEATEFRENLACVKINVAQSDGNTVRYNFLDTMGIRLSDKLYNAVYSPYASDGMIVVEKESGTWLLTIKGKEIRLPVPYDNILPFQDGAAIVSLTRKYGLINKQAKEILPCEYDYVGDMSEGFVRIFQGELPDLADDVRMNPIAFKGKWGFANTKGEIILVPTYDYVLPFQNGFAKVKENGKWGFIDKTGKLVVPCEYEQLWNVAENVARFKQNRKFGAINSVGKVIIPPQYSELWEAREGSIVAAFNEKYGFLDANGKTIIPFEYDDAQYFSEGKAAVMKQGKWGIVDKTGENIIPFNYDEISPFKNGIAKVANNQRFGYIDATGKEIIPLIYTAISPFKNGIAKANKGNYFQLINDKGKSICPLHLEYDINPANEKAITASEGLVGSSSHTFSGYTNAKGEEVIPAIYESTMNNEADNAVFVRNMGKAFVLDAEGRSLVNPDLYDDYSYRSHADTFIFKRNNIYFLVGRNGGPLLLQGYENEIHFSEGFAAAKKGGKWGFINTKGDWAIAPQYNWATNFINGQARVFMANDKDAYVSGIDEEMVQEASPDFLYPILNVQGKWGRINKQNEVVIPLEYEGLEDFYPNEPSRVMIGERWSYIDSEGNILTDSLEYDGAEPFQYGMGIIRKGELTGIINVKGEWLVPLKYKYITILSSKMLLCQDEKEISVYLNEKGKPIFESGITDTYLYASNKNVLLLQKNKLWGIADSTGKMLTPFQYNTYELDEKGNNVFIKVSQNQKVGILAANGTEILPIKYDNAEKAYRDIYIVVENRKYALYNLAERKFLCNFVYDAIARLEDGRFYAYKGTKLSYLNDEGKCIENCE